MEMSRSLAMTTQPEPYDGTVSARLTDLRAWQRTFDALQDTDLRVDDPARFERTTALIEANLLIARDRLETVPPEDIVGVTLLLRYGLSITDDPRMAAVIKSCLVTLLETEADREITRVDDLPDEAFDAALNWRETGQTKGARDSSLG